MKKILTALTVLTLLCGCTAKKQTDDYTGPVATEDPLTDEEKELQMIQSCISAYNNNEIQDLEDSLQTSITPLPIGITSLPEISSLSDLVEVKDAEASTNTTYVGQYTIQDSYYAIFSIYKPKTGSFWLNGSVTFNIDPSAVTVNNPQFAEYKPALDLLLEMDNLVLNWL